jgi:imidazolonepropionase-like amidohydrolase
VRARHEDPDPQHPDAGQRGHPRPLLDADSIQIEGGRITAVGKGLEDGADTVIDAKGSTVIPA